MGRIRSSEGSKCTCFIIASALLSPPPAAAPMTARRYIIILGNAFVFRLRPNASDQYSCNSNGYLLNGKRERESASIFGAAVHGRRCACERVQIETHRSNKFSPIWKRMKDGAMGGKKSVESTWTGTVERLRRSIHSVSIEIKRENALHLRAAARLEHIAAQRSEKLLCVI